MSSFAAVKRKVGDQIGDALLAELCRFVSERQPQLWGEHRPRDFFDIYVCLALFKDLFGLGYVQLQKSISFSFRPSLRSLLHNIQLIRVLLGEWAKSRMRVGTSNDWDAAARYVKKDRKFPVSVSQKCKLKPRWLYKFGTAGVSVD
jgi:hypothetical protein